MAWYFAYGSNMHSGTLRGRRGVGYAQAVPARVEGWRLVLDKPGLLPTGEAFANIVPESGADVYGVLFEVTDDDLQHIDLTEGVLIGNYRRVEVPAISLAAPPAVHSAFSLTSARRQAGLLPTTRYMSLLIDGALEHGLPPEYVDFLRRVPARPESPESAQLRPMLDEFMRKRGGG